MASKNTVIVSDQTFDQEVLKSSQLAIVDFWAEWCGPCRMLAPTLDAVADEFQGKVKICKINVDENQGTPGQYHIRGIPTLLFFKNGTLVDQLVGNQPKQQIQSTIEKHL